MYFVLVVGYSGFGPCFVVFGVFLVSVRNLVFRFAYVLERFDISFQIGRAHV